MAFLPVSLTKSPECQKGRCLPELYRNTVPPIIVPLPWRPLLCSCILVDLPKWTAERNCWGAVAPQLHAGRSGPPRGTPWDKYLNSTHFSLYAEGLCVSAVPITKCIRLQLWNLWSNMKQRSLCFAEVFTFVCDVLSWDSLKARTSILFWHRVASLYVYESDFPLHLQ